MLPSIRASWGAKRYGAWHGYRNRYKYICCLNSRLVRTPALDTCSSQQSFLTSTRFCDSFLM